jgi:hypothetical protein
MRTPIENPLQTTLRQHLIQQAEAWLMTQGYKVTGPDRLVDSSGSLADVQHMQQLYRLDTALSNGRGITKELRQDALSVAITNLEKATVAQLAATIAFDEHVVEHGMNELYKWVAATTALPHEDITIPFLVMRHFIWQVKRKLIDKRVTFHLMPLLFGSIQGSGKSRGIQALLEPLSRYTINSKTVPEIIDSRNFRTLSLNYVCFLDEMGKSEVADIESLKNIITAETMNYRPLYTNGNMTAVQRSTFIGASNKDIRSLIKDQTGMRRFYQINCKPEAKSQALWDIVSALDINAIWRSVDENQDVPEIKDYLDDLSRHQEGIRAKNAIEEYAIEFNVKKGEARVPLKTLYTSFKNYCDEAKLHPFSKPVFTQEFEQLGFTRGVANYGVYFLLDKAPSTMQDVSKRVKET